MLLQKGMKVPVKGLRFLLDWYEAGLEYRAGVELVSEG